MHDNLYAFLYQGFGAHLEHDFLTQPGQTALTYGTLDELSARCAALLRDLGVQPGDRVVVQVGKSAEAVALYLGCLRAGAIYVPLNTAYTGTEIGYFLQDAAPALFVCREHSAVSQDIAVVLQLADDGSGEFSDALAAHQPDPELVRLEPDSVVSMIYTSGTTGRSKGAMLTLNNLVSNAASLYDIWGWQPSDVLLHALPIFHVHGLFVALHCAMLGGSRVLFHQRFEVDAVRRALHDATVMMGVPTFYTRLLADPEFSAADCHGMRLFISGSAPLLATSFDEFAKRTGHRILERYGMSEAGMITSNPLDGERVAGTVGYPLPGVDLRIADDNGLPLPAGEVGVIEIRGPNVFAGYWKQPDKTAAEFREDGFFITGDLGSIVSDGRVTIVGRAKDLIISGGYNIYPKEIEASLDELAGVMESAVIGVPQADLGEAVVAVLVADPQNEPEADAIIRQLENRLARFKQPRRIFFVPELPRNAMGKVQKQALRERYRHALD
ncbi:MAG: AMP-binding protein [Gammaproteobacteria bacterium]|nr:AMP-binding protein [Gammaproteobacteria bacterium]